MKERNYYLTLYNLETRHLLNYLSNPVSRNDSQGITQNICISPDGRLFATGSLTHKKEAIGMILIYKTSEIFIKKNFKVLPYKILNGSDNYNYFTFSSNGKLLAAVL